MDISQTINTNIKLADPSVKYKLLDPGYWFDNIVSFFRFIFEIIFSQAMGDLLQIIFILLTIFFITLIAYCAVRMFEIRAKQHNHLHHEIAEYARRQQEKEKKRREEAGISTNPRWVKVIDYLVSTNVNDWKLAIIEADSMLDGLMGDLGFKGENLGEKLKNADRDKFRNLTAAWEVHTLRNRIAHEGASFELSQHEAKRAVAMYEQIFREFGYI